MGRLGKTPGGAQLRQLVAIANESNRLDAERGSADPSESLDELLSRRTLLRLAGAAAATRLAGSALANAARFVDHAPARRKEVRVAIIGGGIAGLSAAYHLKRHGVHAQVYEAQNRIGGRIWTRDDVLAQGLVTEVGASFIDSVHTDMLRLAKTFGIEMWDTMAPSELKLQPAYFFGGRVRRNKEVLAAMKPFVAKIAHDQKYATVDSYKKYTPLAKALDQLSTADYLKKIGVEGWLYDFLDVALTTENGTEIDKLSSLQCFGELGTNTSGPYELFASSDQRYHTKGGNSLIPEALTSTVKDQIHLGHRLESLRKYSAGAYELTFQTAGGAQEVKADYVIMTLPFKILRDLEVDLDLPAKKDQAIQELNYGDNCKLILGFNERFWRKQGTTGLFFTDLPIQSGWDSGWRQPTRASSLTLFFGGQSAVDQAGIPIEERVRRYLLEIEKMFPGAAEHFDGQRIELDWPHFEYIKASYSSYAVGQQTTFGGVEIETVDRLYFAGEHCDSNEQGYMNGGAKTGRIAAQNLVAAIR